MLDSHLSMMEALGRAIAKRDSDTDAHNYRVAWIAARLAEGMGLAGSAMQALIAGSFLWSLVSCVLANYFLVDDGETLHQLIGYLASMLVAARIVWGFVGSRHARFAEFFPTPARMRRHLERLMSGRQEFHPGHNPVGALMMLALITLVLALGVTGFMQTLDAFWGEEWLQDVHEMLGSTLIGLAGVPAAAAIVMSRVERTNLIGAMITGVKVQSGTGSAR